MSDRSTDQAREWERASKTLRGLATEMVRHERELLAAGDALAARLRVVLKAQQDDAETSEAAFARIEEILFGDVKLRDSDDLEEQARVVLKERDEALQREEVTREQLAFLVGDKAVVQADLLRAEEALQAYADPKNWGISRDDLNHRVVSWIGPGAEVAGLPDAPSLARAALSPKGQPQK